MGTYLTLMLDLKQFSSPMYVAILPKAPRQTGNTIAEKESISIGKMWREILDW